MAEQGKRMMIRSRLREIMESKGLTRMDVVRGAKLSYPTVTRWEDTQEMGRLDTKVLDSLCQFLAVQPGDILEYVEVDDTEEESKGE